MNRIFRISVLFLIAFFALTVPWAAAEENFAAAVEKDFYFRLDLSNLYDNISPAFRQKLMTAQPGAPQSASDFQTKVFGFGRIFPQFNQKIRVEGRVVEADSKNSLMSNFALLKAGLVSGGGVSREQKINGKNVQDVHFPKEHAWLRFFAVDAKTTDVLYISGGDPGNWSSAPANPLEGAPAVFSGEPQLAVIALRPARLHQLLPKEHAFFRLFGKSSLLTLNVKVRQDILVFEFKADRIPQTELPMLKNWANGLQTGFQGIRLTPSLSAGLLTISGEVDMNKFGIGSAVPPVPGMMKIK